MSAGYRVRLFGLYDMLIKKSWGGGLMFESFRHANIEQLVAFSDGSFREGLYVYAFTLKVKMGSYLAPLIRSAGECTIFFGHNNVSCELEACYRAIQTAQTLGAKFVTLYTDFLGCIKFLTGECCIRHEQFSMYVKLMSELSIPFTIQHVPGHSGIQGNDEVDRLANREVDRILAKSKKGTVIIQI